MSFRWLKPYLPRGLYGRATLILLLPVVTLLLVVSVVFIQRHFEGVTQQMTRTMMREIRLVLTRDDPAIAEALGIDVQAGARGGAAERRTHGSGMISRASWWRANCMRLFPISCAWRSRMTTWWRSISGAARG